MTLFYDPVDEGDQLRIEEILRKGGMEYFLREEPEKNLAPCQIHVAEEDIPRAEKLLEDAQSPH